MRDLVVWSGPVASFQVPGATLPDAKTLFLNCCGDLTPPCKPPTCPTIGNTLMGSPELLLARAKMTREELGDLLLAGFSAGGSVMGRLLKNPDYRALVSVVHAADASYTAQWLDKANRIPPPIESYVLYALDVLQAQGGKLLVMTASPSPNGRWATGVENLQAIRREIEKRTGRKFREGTGFFGIEPEPDHIYYLDNVLIAEYPMEPIGHGGHATKLGSQVWEKIIQPWMEKGKGALPGLMLGGPGGIPVPPPPVPPVPVQPSYDIGATEILIGIAATVGGYFAVRVLLK